MLNPDSREKATESCNTEVLLDRDLLPETPDLDTTDTVDDEWHISGLRRLGSIVMRRLPRGPRGLAVSEQARSLYRCTERRWLIGWLIG